MNTPAWRSLYPTHVRRNDQHGQNFTYSIDQIGSQAPVIVILDETPEPSMSHAADMHTDNRTSIPYSRQALLQFGRPGAIAQRLAANALQGFEKLTGQHATIGLHPRPPSGGGAAATTSSRKPACRTRAAWAFLV